MKNKGLAPIAIILIIVGVLVVAGGVWYLYQKSNIKNQNNRQSAAQQSSTADETANWQTYRNEEYGVEVKYPAYFSASYDDIFKDTSDNINHIIFSRGPNLFCPDYPNCPDVVNSPLSKWSFAGDVGDAFPLRFAIKIFDKKNYSDPEVIDPADNLAAKPFVNKSIKIDG